MKHEDVYDGMPICVDLMVGPDAGTSRSTTVSVRTSLDYKNVFRRVYASGQGGGAMIKDKYGGAD